MESLGPGPEVVEPREVRGRDRDLAPVLRAIFATTPNVEIVEATDDVLLLGKGRFN